MLILPFQSQAQEIPPRPSNARLLSLEGIACDIFSLLVAYFDLDTDLSTWERVEYLLPDESLLAVVQREGSSNSIYIKQPSGQVKKYNSVEEANSTPCEDAERILDNRARI